MTVDGHLKPDSLFLSQQNLVQSEVPSMQSEAFKSWLCDTKNLKESTANSRLSNCSRVEQYEGDLDIHFERDQICMLLNKLTYSKEDQRQNHSQRHSIPIAGNIYNGTATLRSAVILYKDFKLSYLPHSIITHTIHKRQKQMKTHKIWPTWDIPSPEVVLKMVKLITPYIRFLHPDIIDAIVKDNEKNQDFWRKKLINHNINPDFYLWEKSSCTFPGIRRYAGSSEISFYRKRSAQNIPSIKDALHIDDNSFPKQIWSFIFRGKPFQNYGPSGYSLAHLADHKDYKNRRDKEFEIIDKAPEKLYGLFTCASNIVYIPASLIKPTDFSSDIRLLLLNKAQNLYGKMCNIIPPNLRIKKTSLDWDINNFDWAEPVGTKTYLNNFFEFRYSKMESL